MKKTKVEPLKESLCMISENSLKRLNQKVKNPTMMAEFTLWEMDKRFSAHIWLLMHSKIIYDAELGKPHMLQKW